VFSLTAGINALLYNQLTGKIPENSGTKVTKHPAASHIVTSRQSVI